MKYRHDLLIIMLVCLLLILIDFVCVRSAKADQYIRFIPQSPAGTVEKLFTAFLSWSEAPIEDITCDEDSGICVGFIPNIQLSITHTVDGLTSEPSNAEEIPINESTACRADTSNNGVVDLPDYIEVTRHLGQACERLNF